MRTRRGRRGGRTDRRRSIGARPALRRLRDQQETERKILRDVFAKGDAWFRTGDLMRKDALGYFYFVDRIGDTFRWKGENVATSEVSEVITVFPGVREANVYGVTGARP
jgi:fatty-acyl-CoA synthase